jgi:hypothetical protein
VSETTTQPWLTIAATPAEREGTTAQAVTDPSTWRAALDARSCTDNQGFFATAKTELDLPVYFGFNWDAFDECFQDLLDISEGGMGSAFGGREGKPTVRLDLAITHAEHLFEHEPTNKPLAVLVRILRDATRAEATYGRRHATLRVTMCCTDSSFDHFMERLRTVGVSDSDLVNGR